MGQVGRGLRYQILSYVALVKTITAMRDSHAKSVCKVQNMLHKSHTLGHCLGPGLAECILLFKGSESIVLFTAAFRDITMETKPQTSIRQATSLKLVDFSPGSFDACYGIPLVQQKILGSFMIWCRRGFAVGKYSLVRCFIVCKLFCLCWCALIFKTKLSAVS